MSFKWFDYIDLADRLIQDASEAAYRSAISRAYYGAFCLARDTAQLSDYGKTDVHKVVADQYLHSSEGKKRLIGNKLEELRRNRNRADYNDPFDQNRHINLKSLASISVHMAKKIAQDL